MLLPSEIKHKNFSGLFHKGALWQWLLCAHGWMCTSLDFFSSLALVRADAGEEKENLERERNLQGSNEQVLCRGQVADCWSLEMKAAEDYWSTLQDKYKTPLFYFLPFCVSLLHAHEQVIHQGQALLSVGRIRVAGAYSFGLKTYEKVRGKKLLENMEGMLSKNYTMHQKLLSMFALSVSEWEKCQAAQQWWKSHIKIKFVGSIERTRRQALCRASWCFHRPSGSKWMKGA